MKNKLLIGVVVACICVAVNNANALVTWGYANDLTADISPPGQDSWWVALYQDVSGDTTLGSVTFNQVTVTPTGVGNSGDDIFQSLIKETVVDGYWNSSQDFTAVAGTKVYTVLFNAATTNAATSSIVLSGADWDVPAGGTGIYTIAPPVANSWQAMVAVPEPFTGVLFGLGLAVVAVVRKRRS